MAGMEPIKEALEEAILKAGGMDFFVASINAPSVNAVKAWKRTNSIPADYCPEIERVTGVVCERLRPSVDWKVLRATSHLIADQSQPIPAGHIANH